MYISITAVPKIKNLRRIIDRLKIENLKNLLRLPQKNLILKKRKCPIVFISSEEELLGLVMSLGWSVPGKF